jgi:hypothetical protein
VKLKYYLRGMGIGIMITTLILIIAFSIHKNDTVQQEEPKQEAASKTVAEAQNSTQIPMDTETETEPATEQNNAEQTDTQKTTEKQKENETSVVSASTEEKASEEKTTEQKTSETKSSEEKISEKNTPAAATEKVRFEVGGGEYSDVICKRLLQAGLIDDADAFNKFLIQKDYDNLILPGVYDIPKGATYEEIAALLTTKVESETAQ